MIQLFDMWLSLFAEKTGIAGKLFLNGQTAAAILVLLGICLMLAGIKVYRLLTSVLLFGATAIALCTCMAGHADWGATVTAFTIIGCLLAFLSYSWKLLDAVIFSALAAAAVLWHFCPLWWAACIAGILAGGLTCLFPLAGITFFTAAAGSCLFMELFPGNFPVIAAAASVCAGTGVQLLLFGRKQKLFLSTMPGKVRLWLSRRKASAKG